MEKFTHYGKEVLYQTTGHSFKKQLKDAGISYIDLPILLYNVDVVTYTYEGKTRFAVIEDKCGYENIYITDSIPLDFSWKKLIEDCNDQEHGMKPMKMRTKAKEILLAAEKMILDNQEESEFVFALPEEISPKEYQIALIHMGYDIKELVEMDHWDVDEELIQKLKERI